MIEWFCISFPEKGYIVYIEDVERGAELSFFPPAEDRFYTVGVCVRVFEMRIEAVM